MAFLDNLLNNLPEVRGPKQKRLPFKEKLKWSLITLVLFYVMGMVPLFGLGENALEQFEFLSIILGASFGSIISLGIGPLVTASIVLQLLTGTGILNLDMNSAEGRKRFQGLQKVSSIFFVILEACIYILMGGLSPSAIGSELATNVVMTQAMFVQFQMILIFQLILGGILIMFMDEVISKWGFGSGISLFIAAGVSQQIFIRVLNPLSAGNREIGLLGYPFGIEAPVGKLWELFYGLSIGSGDGGLMVFSLALGAIASTVIVFAICVYGQAMKVEIPLSFGRVRGYGMRWPLNFFYTSNIPVILVAALMANIQLFARLLENWGHPFLGTFAGQSPASGIVYWISPPNILEAVIQNSLTFPMIGQALAYIFVFMIGSTIFSIFWMQTANMDAKSQAKQIMSSGLQIPGFRRDERVLEKILNRYIWPLTVVGGAAVGLLAALADLTGALSNGTGILLAVMIVYKLYEEIAKQHMMDIHPSMRKFME
jgi:preprotein translocase subunit SecY